MSDALADVTTRTPSPAATAFSVKPRKERSGRTGDYVVAGISQTLMVIWSLLVILPLIWTLLSSFKTSSQIQSYPLQWPSPWEWVNYSNAWTISQVGSYALNTVIVVVCALFGTMLLGSMCAYVLARFKFFGARFIYYLMLAGLTFPIFLAIVPLFFVLQSFSLLNTLPGLIITYVAYSMPFTVFFMYAFFRTLPYEIYEAAQIDGASDWRIFFQVMLPMAAPGLSAVAIFNFLGLWNQYLLPVALNTQPQKWVLTQGMAAFQSQAGYSTDFGALFAGVVITVLPVVVVYVLFQRRLQGSVSPGTDK